MQKEIKLITRSKYPLEQCLSRPQRREGIKKGIDKKLQDNRDIFISFELHTDYTPKLSGSSNDQVASEIFELRREYSTSA